MAPFCFSSGFMRDGGDLGAAPDQAFGEEKSRRQLEVVTGGSHGDAESGIADANLQRLFADEVILDGAHFSFAPFLDAE